MKKIILLLFFCFLSSTIVAQHNSEEKAIKKVIEIFFEGLHNGDSTLIKTTLHSSLKLQSTSNNREGKSILNTQTKSEFLKVIASKKVTDTYLEKLGSFDIKIDGNLASVWTPYEFYYNGKFSHCGANSFQLFKNNGIWEITYLIDMRRREKCTSTIENK